MIFSKYLTLKHSKNIIMHVIIYYDILITYLRYPVKLFVDNMKKCWDNRLDYQFF